LLGTSGGLLPAALTSGTADAVDVASGEPSSAQVSMAAVIGRL
jgi:hypothetical protein